MEDWCVTSDSWQGGPSSQEASSCSQRIWEGWGRTQEGGGQERVWIRRDKENHVNNLLPPPPLSVISDKNTLILWVWSYRQQVARPIPAPKQLLEREGVPGKGIFRWESAHSNWPSPWNLSQSTCTTHEADHDPDGHTLGTFWYDAKRVVQHQLQQNPLTFWLTVQVPGPHPPDSRQSMNLCRWNSLLSLTSCCVFSSLLHIKDDLKWYHLGFFVCLFPVFHIQEMFQRSRDSLLRTVT